MSPMETRIETELAELDRLSSAALRERWAAMGLGPVPRISPAMLRLALGWELQARALGGLDRQTSQRLAQAMAAKSSTALVEAGSRLVREWRGKAHVVTIDEDGAIGWNGKTWRSLSEVARAITGTRWSGPAFFGLRKAVQP